MKNQINKNNVLSLQLFKDVNNFELIKSYVHFIEFLNSFNIEYLETKITDRCKIVAIDNKTKEKHTADYIYLAGQSKYYFIDGDKTIIHVDNYLSPEEEGGNWTVHNCVSIKSSNQKAYEAIGAKAPSDAKIKDVEDDIRRVLGVYKEPKFKYVDIYEFAKTNNKLFSKYFKATFPVSTSLKEVTYDTNSLRENMAKLLKKINENSIENKIGRLNLPTLEKCLDAANIDYTYFIKSSKLEIKNKKELST